MVGLATEQRRTLIDKLPDTASLILGALVLGQFVTHRSFLLWVATGGVVGWLVLLGWALWLGRGGRA